MSFIYEYGYVIADFLTLIRGIVVLFMLSLIPDREVSLDIFMIMVFIAWFTDVFDGFFARKSKRMGYLGKWDGWVDTAFYITIFLYCYALGFYSFKFFILVLIFNFLAVFLTRNLEVNQAFHFLYILLGFRTIYLLDKLWFIRVSLWTILVIILKWSRLKFQIRNFIDSWKNLLLGKKGPSH